MINKIKFILSLFFVYISIVGVVIFSLFIIEEAFQTAMFGTWPAQDAGRWDIVKDGIVLMESITWTGKTVNTFFGWIQPFAFISYGEYFKSAKFYTIALKAKCLANDPELFIGETIEIKLRIKRFVKNKLGYMVRFGRIGIIFKEKPELNSYIEFKGKLEQIDGKLMIFYEKNN